MDQLIGRSVVLLEFWDFARINSLRTLPYLRAWHERYADAGLRVILVQSPGYSFGADDSVARSAIERLEIPMPAVLDPDFAGWRGYGNKGWPGPLPRGWGGRAAFGPRGRGRVRGPGPPAGGAAARPQPPGAVPGAGRAASSGGRAGSEEAASAGGHRAAGRPPPPRPGAR